MARADILKRRKVLSTISGNSQMAYGAILTRSEIHQKLQSQELRDKKISVEFYDRVIPDMEFFCLDGR